MAVVASRLASRGFWNSSPHLDNPEFTPDSLRALEETNAFLRLAPAAKRRGEGVRPLGDLDFCDTDRQVPDGDTLARSC